MAPLIVVVWGTVPVRSTTFSALARDAPKNTAPAASASAATAFDTFLIRTHFQKAIASARGRKEVRTSTPAFSPGYFAALCSEFFLAMPDGWPCHTHGIGSPI